MNMTPHQLARLIDHTVLKPDAPQSAVRKLCEEAEEHNFISVCIHPCHVPLAHTLLQGSTTLVCTVIGFPLGANTLSTKVFEAEDALRHGARELDMVIAIGAVKSGEWSVVEAEIKAVVQAAESGKADVKVIIECAYLTGAEKRQAAEIVAASGAAFVKTSTGFGPSGATVEDVRLLRETVGTRCGVKAAGGIRDLKTALAMLDAGASRLGTSAGVSLLTELFHEAEAANTILPKIM